MTDHPCKGMTKRQREAFEQIAISQPPQATHKTLVALRERGLIDYKNETIGRDALGAITVPRWFVPLLVQMQWCEWASEQPETADNQL